MVAAASDGDQKMIVLISSDNERFELTESAANLSKAVGNMIEDGCTDNGIPLANVTANVLAKVVEYCKRHADDVTTVVSGSEAATAESDVAAKAKKEEEELKEFDAKFVKVDNTMLFELLNAANFMNIPCLLELTCQRAATLIKQMTVEEVRELFQIKNDFTPEEEAEVRRENAWAFE